MKALLVNPKITYDNPYTAVGFRLPPLNLLYIAPYFINSGFEVDICDEVIKSFEKYNLKDYQIVGITSDTPRFNRAMAIARASKGAGKIVIMGGPHVTFEDVSTLQTGCVDYIVRNEAELILPHLLEAIKNNIEPHEVKGISWIDRNGKIHRQPGAPLPENLDALPLPARNIVNMDDYKLTKIFDRPITSVFTSRGCPYNCDFCITPQLGNRKWRKREPLKVVDEVEFLINTYGFRAIAFLDDNFAVSEDHLISICNEIIKRKLDILWYCQMRTDKIADNEPLVKLMAEAGCFWVFLGLESGSQNILKGMKKKNHIKKGRNAVNLLKKYGIRALASFTIGHAQENKDDIEETIRYALDVDPPAAQFCVVTPYPGSEIYTKYKNRIVSFNWDYFNSTRAVMYTDCLNPKQLQSLLRKCYVRFFLRPRRIWRAIGGSTGKYQMGVKQTVKLLKSISPDPIIE